MTDDPMPWDNLEISQPAAQAALARLDASWHALLAILDAIPEDNLADPGVSGDWSIGDLLGHIAFWNRHSLERGRDVLEGRPFVSVRVEEMNARDIEARQGRTASENMADMIESHDDMLAFVQAAPTDPAILVPLLARMGMDTDQHYDEHVAEIRAWRNAQRI
ncbi:MAG: DinB family protein [Thermomicrobiales bacterium]